MSKYIKITEANIDAEVEKFKEAIKVATGDITYKITAVKSERKAKVVFTPESYCKMISLIMGCDKEIAWNGLARRGSDDLNDDTYIIYDILCHPQEVTGATVNTDQVEYEKWLMGLDDDEFNNMRFQGHSHVNMGVTPSGTDERLYDELLARLDNDMFYIFQIWNKKGDKTIRIYDYAKNIFFDTSDCSVEILGCEDFKNQAFKMIKTKTVTTSPSKQTKQKEDKTLPPPVKTSKNNYNNYDWRDYYSGSYGYYGNYID